MVGVVVQDALAPSNGAWKGAYCPWLLPLSHIQGRLSMG